MRKILLFGDSIMTGYDSELHNGTHYPQEKRWVTYLTSVLSNKFEVVCNAKTGRPLVSETENIFDREWVI